MPGGGSGSGSGPDKNDKGGNISRRSSLDAGEPQSRGLEVLFGRLLDGLVERELDEVDA